MCIHVYCKVTQVNCHTKQLYRLLVHFKNKSVILTEATNHGLSQLHNYYCDVCSSCNYYGMHSKTMDFQYWLLLHDVHVYAMAFCLVYYVHNIDYFQVSHVMVYIYIYIRQYLGIGELCWHNFENNRYALTLESNASILGTNRHYLGHTSSYLVLILWKTNSASHMKNSTASLTQVI